MGRKLKHSKIKNTGVLFELLVRQITTDTLNGVEKSPALTIVKEYFGKKTTLKKELDLYNSLNKEKFNIPAKAEKFLDLVLKERSKISSTVLKRQKYKVEEDAGIALFDIENDGDLDLYIAHGSAQFEPGSIAYDDVIWINDGKGNFSLLDIVLPNNGLNASCVKAADFDHDGDLDLFVGNRVIPGQYPVSGKSFLLENKSTIDKPMLVDCSEKLKDRKSVV